MNSDPIFVLAASAGQPTKQADLEWLGRTSTTTFDIAAACATGTLESNSRVSIAPAPLMISSQAATAK